MNRKELQILTSIRLKEAKALLDSRLYDGAYYLCGYAVECGLKACLAKQTKRHDFPDKDIVRESYTHDLNKLLGLAGLGIAHKVERNRDSIFNVNWATVKDWETSAIGVAPKQRRSYSALADKNHEYCNG